MAKVAIIGGGPGSLMTAYQLEKKVGSSCQITLFEATERIGGKIVTAQFNAAPVIYEAGVAEIYDYSAISSDSLRQLIDKLGLETIPMDGQGVVLDGKILRNKQAIRKFFG